MKFLRQIAIILGVSFAGELLRYMIPLPVPASIYGLVLMLILLCTGILKPVAVRETSSFLLDMMPLMLIPAGSGVIDRWDIIKPILIPCILLFVVATVLVMVVTGRVTQRIIRRKDVGKNA